MVRAKKFDPNVTNAVVVYTDEDGDEHKVDFIKVPRGISDSQKVFLEKAIPTAWDTHAMLVMNPWQILRSRLANLEQLDTHKGEHSQAQGRAAIACMLAFTNQVLIEKGRAEAMKVIKQLKEYLFLSKTPCRVWKEFGIDARDAILPPTEMLGEAYGAKFYPITIEQITKKWNTGPSRK